LIEDLVVSAFNDAADKARTQVFTFLPFVMGTHTDEDEGGVSAEMIETAKALAQDKAFMAQVGEPLISALMDALATLEEEEDEDRPPRRGR